MQHLEELIRIIHEAGVVYNVRTMHNLNHIKTMRAAGMTVDGMYENGFNSISMELVPEYDKKELIIVLSHEFGHHLDYIRLEEEQKKLFFMETVTANLRRMCGLPDSVEEAITAISREMSAWDNGASLLNRLGFNAWLDFDHHKSISLVTYQRRLDFAKQLQDLQQK